VLDADVIAEEPRRLAAGVRDQGLFRVQFQSEGLPEELRYPGLDFLGFGLRPGESQNMIVGLCRLRDYAGLRAEAAGGGTKCGSDVGIIRAP
jgi:hypothetical protein